MNLRTKQFTTPAFLFDTSDTYLGSGMRCLILTSCTAKKRYGRSDIDQILQGQNLPFPTCDLRREGLYRSLLSAYILPARDMYGGSFKHVRNLVDFLRQAGHEVDCFIVSARYGLIGENYSVIPYECVINNSGIARRRSEELRIYDKLRGLLVAQKYDRVILVLGRHYLITILDPKTGKNITNYLNNAELVVFGARSMRRLFNYHPLTFISVSGLGDRNKKLIRYAKNLK